MGANIGCSSRDVLRNSIRSQRKSEREYFKPSGHRKIYLRANLLFAMGVPIPNILAIPEAIEKYGKYPIEK